MVAGSEDDGSVARPLLRGYASSRRRRRTVADRFIPVRAEMDFAFAHYMLTDGRKRELESDASASPSTIAYRKHLAEALGMNRSRMLVFKRKSPPRRRICRFQENSFENGSSHSRPPRRHIPERPDKMLDAPYLVDDESLNLLDWSSSNVVAIALGDTVCMWDASNRAISELVSIDDDNGPITSISWAPDGQRLAVGLNSSEVQLWDTIANRRLRTLQGGHVSRVGSLSWNNHVLTTGGMDGFIVNNDVRMRSHIVDTYLGHREEISSLKWSDSGRQLASGGKDNLLHIWDRSMTSSISATRWLHQFDHHASVKALAWCPFQSNLLASGGGVGNGSIKFWKTNTGALLHSVNAGSEVWSLIWSKNERELLSSHGPPQNQLTLWKYPAMVKMADLTGHTQRVLFMAQSPDGSTVASASSDETLRFWNVFGTPQGANPTGKTSFAGPFSNVSFIR